MSQSRTNRRSIVRGMLDLERRDGLDHGWDIATVLAAAQHHHRGDGRRPEISDVSGLLKSRLIHRRFRDAKYELTESARARGREGSL